MSDIVVEPNCGVVETNLNGELHHQVVVPPLESSSSNDGVHWPKSGDVWLFKKNGVPVMVTGRSGSSGKGELVHWLCLSVDSRGRLVDIEWGWTQLKNWMREHIYVEPSDKWELV